MKTLEQYVVEGVCAENYQKIKDRLAYLFSKDHSFMGMMIEGIPVAVHVKDVQMLTEKIKEKDNKKPISIDVEISDNYRNVNVSYKYETIRYGKNKDTSYYDSSSTKEEGCDVEILFTRDASCRFYIDEKDTPKMFDIEYL